MTSRLRSSLAILHLLVLIPNAFTSVISAFNKVDSIQSLIHDADPIDCQDPSIRFEEPCRCYRMNNQQTILNCDNVAFRFFPFMPPKAQIQHVSFRNTGYQGLPNDIFSKDNHVLRLDLSMNYILSISSGALSGLENSLLQLNLSSNSLGKNLQPVLEIPALRMLRNLRVLDLSRNGIKVLSFSIFDGLENIEQLFLSGNDLMDVRFLHEVTISKNLKVLDLQENRLFRLDAFEFIKLPGLLYLNLEGNFVSLLQPNAFNGTSLREIILRKNGIKSMDTFVFGGIASTLEILDLSYNALKQMPSLEKATRLRQLDLSNNVILDSAGWKLSVSLTFLDFSGNLITTESLSKLSNLNSLQTLHLSRNFLGNKIENMGLFLEQLETLDLRSTNLTVIPADFLKNFPNLQFLDLSYNVFLDAAPTVIANRFLRKLNLAHCQIKDINNVILDQNKMLDELDLSRNLLTDTAHPALINLPKSITVLSLPDNNLLEVPDFVLFKDLKLLDLSGNHLKSINLQLLPMQSLEILDLSYNNLVEFPSTTNLEPGNFAWSLASIPSNKSVFSPSQKFVSALKIFKLSGNWINKIETALTGHPNLTYFKLTFSGLQSLPMTFFSDLNLLRDVNISGNKLTELVDDTFINLPELRTLDLSNNKLTGFTGSAIRNCTNLSFINISKNRIRSLSAANFEQLPVLAQLMLGENSITQLENDLFRGTAIEELDLSRNFLDTFSNLTLSQMPKLRRMNLSYNRLIQIDPFIFVGIPQLQYLDLSHNGLHTFSEGSFRGLRRLSVNLSHNKLDRIRSDIFDRYEVDRVELLDLSFNGLVSFPERALGEQDSNLIILNLSNNKLTEVPPGSLISVKNMDVSGNPISESSIKTLLSDPKLTFALSLANNNLTRFPILQLQFLTQLNLSSNRLVNCGNPSDWNRAVLLQDLDLSNNMISDLRDSQISYVLQKLTFLKSLDLSGNPIQNIREGDLSGLINVDLLTISNLPALETFDISNLLEFPRLSTLLLYNFPRVANLPVEDISQLLPKMTSVYLELKYSTLKDQINGFLTPSLQNLLIFGPLLSRLSPQVFAGLNPEQFRLSFYNVLIEMVPARIFAKFPRSAKIDLSFQKSKITVDEVAGLIQSFPADDATITFVNNRIECVCNFSVELAVIKLYGNNSGKITCDYPASQTGRSVISTDLTNLPCEEDRSEPASFSLAEQVKASKKNIENSAVFLHRQKSAAITEPDIIFEITTAKPVAADYHLEGIIAGIVLGLVSITGLIIASIVYWNRREKRKLIRQTNYVTNEQQYAAVANPNIVVQPSWYPPPQPMLVVPLPSNQVLQLEKHEDFYPQNDTEENYYDENIDWDSDYPQSQAYTADTFAVYDDPYCQETRQSEHEFARF